MIKVAGGTSAFFSTVRIKNAKFKIGTDLSTVREYFTTDSTGYVQVIVEDDAELHGGDGNANGGKTYPAFKGLINITSTGENDFSVVSRDPPYSGVYTPTVAAVANIAGQSAAECQYLRVGNTVTVSGKVNVTPNVGGSITTRVSVSLPVTSNLAASYQCAGTTVATTTNESGIIIGDFGNDVAILQFYPAAATPRDMYFTFTYQVLP
jgi:hypothetical protein